MFFLYSEMFWSTETKTVKIKDLIRRISPTDVNLKMNQIQKRQNIQKISLKQPAPLLAPLLFQSENAGKWFWVVDGKLLWNTILYNIFQLLVAQWFQKGLLYLTCLGLLLGGGENLIKKKLFEEWT